MSGISILCVALAMLGGCRDEKRATPSRDDASVTKERAFRWKAQPPVIRLDGAQVRVQGRELDAVPSSPGQRLPKLQRALNEVRVVIERDSRSKEDPRAGRFVVEGAETALPVFAVVHAAYAAGYRRVGFSPQGPWLELEHTAANPLAEPAVSFAILVDKEGVDCGNSLDQFALVELANRGSENTWRECFALALDAPAKLGMELGEVEISANGDARFASLVDLVRALEWRNLSPLVFVPPDRLSVRFRQ